MSAGAIVSRHDAKLLHALTRASPPASGRAAGGGAKSRHFAPEENNTGLSSVLLEAAL